MTISFCKNNHDDVVDGVEDDVVEIDTKKSEQVTVDQDVSDKMQPNIPLPDKDSTTLTSISSATQEAIDTYFWPSNSFEC
ncbi:hypothetical protein H5410_061495 [Solanum commersonii]|uniref:Uncharacterized protein n=1 Tax=Solanum commersonii TaxID=4109 RepID=A0A9J5W877_SOLCO|nr:hypothetical protein H5410_061495 [Solanum commersonii]